MTISKLDEYWSKYYQTDNTFLALSPQNLDRILSHTKRSSVKTHLDIGCGIGELCTQLSSVGFQSIGIDPSAVAVAKAQQQIHGNNPKYIHTSFDEFESAHKFGLITAKYVVAFIENLSEFMKKASSLLEKDGLLVIITPFREDSGHNLVKISVDKSAFLDALQPHFMVVDEFKSDIDTVVVCRIKS